MHQQTQNIDAEMHPTPQQKHPNTGGWYRKTYSFLGFQKAYNFPLFVIFAGAMFAFSLSRLMYLDLAGIYAKSAAPGEWFWYHTGHYRIGITLHLGAVLPAGLLMIWQFIPAIRHRFLIFHRINGYTVVVLILVGHVGALMIVRRSFGGALSTQAAVGTLVILTTTTMALAIYNVKKLQIDQHRAWMLRTMFYMGTIITTRFIMIISALIISKIGSYFINVSCNELRYMHRFQPGYVDKTYQSCRLGNESAFAVVNANFSGGKDGIGASFKLSFGMALWMSIFLHMIGVEIYLNLTPRESQRLRQVSYERQLEAGYENPGSAGLVVERFGDADEWVPKLLLSKQASLDEQ